MLTNVVNNVIMITVLTLKNTVRFMAFAALLLAAISYTMSYSYAQTSNSNSDIRKAFDQTFYQMLDDPADLEVTMRYANLAVQLKDYEAAIPALERILLFNPDLPRIKQELGVLYYKLDSMDMARSYLEDSKNGKNVPADVLAAADKYLNQIR